MSEQTAESRTGSATDALIRQLHGLVIYGPWDLDVSWAMSACGYDAVKWAEGQCVLAELVSCDTPTASSLAAAAAWYQEAATTAQRALAGKPQLLAKLGLGGVCQG